MRAFGGFLHYIASLSESSLNGANLVVYVGGGSYQVIMSPRGGTPALFSAPEVESLIVTFLGFSCPLEFVYRKFDPWFSCLRMCRHVPADDVCFEGLSFPVCGYEGHCAVPFIFVLVPGDVLAYFFRKVSSAEYVGCGHLSSF